LYLSLAFCLELKHHAQHQPHSLPVLHQNLQQEVVLGLPHFAELRSWQDQYLTA